MEETGSAEGKARCRVPREETPPERPLPGAPGAEERTLRQCLAEAEARQAHVLRVLRAIRNVNQLILREGDPLRLAGGACADLTETMGYLSAWIALWDAESGAVTAAVASGFDAGFEELRGRLGRGELPPCMRRGLEAEGVRVVEDRAPDCAGCPLEGAYAGRARLACRLAFEGRVYGFLAVSLPPPFARDGEEGALFREVAGDLGFALHRMREAEALRASERALAESERTYRALYESMTEGMALHEVLFDPEGRPVDYRLLEVNPAFERILGLSRADVLGRGAREVYGTEAAPYLDLYAEVARTGVPVAFETRYEPMGRTFSISVFSPRRGQFATVFEDVSERDRAEEALRRSEAFRRALVRAIPDLVWLKDPEGVYLSCNPTFERFFGVPEAEIVGRTDYDFLDRELADFFREHDRRALEADAPSVNEEWLTFASDGYRGLFETIKTPMRDAEGRLVGVLGISRDISERHRAEEEREKLRQQLLQAQKMESVGRLAGGVAHDFNNMLGVIVGHAEMALELDRSGPTCSHLQEIRKAALRSADLTRQLLAFARRQTIAPRVLDLNEVVTNMLRILKRLIGEDIDLVWTPGEGLWPIRMDPSQIDQILANLCVNARDAISGVGRIVIETENVLLDDAYCAGHLGFIPGSYVQLAVSDDGCGMDGETLRHVFEPFFTTKGLGQGTGLGLATVYGVVRQNEGFVNVYSEPGQGTTFRIYLPRHESEGIPASGEAEAPGAANRGGETLLLVEDEPAILNMGRAMLERMGYRVLAAGSPGEALRQVREWEGRIDLLLTDVVMPEMNGRELAGRLQAAYPDLKVLFMSGYTSNVVAHRGVLDEGVNFLQKPFSLATLSAKVRAILDGTESR